MRKFPVLSIILLLIIQTDVFAQQAPHYRNAKSIGMGNTRIAHGVGYNGFIDNPALLSRVTITRFSIANVPFGTNQNAIDIARFISDNVENFQTFNPSSPNYMDFYNEMQDYNNKWGYFNVSPISDIAFNILGFGLGVAFYNISDIGLMIDPGEISLLEQPRIFGNGISTTVGIIGFSHGFMLPGLTLGANLKYINRRNTGPIEIAASELADSPSKNFDPIMDELKENANVSTAVDIGALWSIPLTGFDVGGVIRNIGDGKNSGVDVGVSKRFLLNTVVLTADLTDIFDRRNQNYGDKLHIGAQARLGPMVFRTGVSGQYQTFGAGLNFRLVDIDFAKFRDEFFDNEDRYLMQVKVGW